jgi:hypothetical protein
VPTKHLQLSELIDREARFIATEILEARLTKFDLPLPKESALDIHIDAILAAKPELYEQAKTRVEARKDAFSEALRAIDIEVEIAQVLDI